MDIISSTIYIILFILLLVFVFSMALLTPMVGKKGFLPVIATGFIIGLIGGGFLIAPIYDELPFVVESFSKIFDHEEVIYIEFSTRINASDLIKELKEIDGVSSVENEGLFLETTSFSNERKKIIEEKIPIVDENFISWYVDSSGTININTTEGYDANNAIKTLSDWLVYTAEIETKYSLIKIKINTQSNKVNNVLSFLEARQIVVTSVEGPAQSAVDNTINTMVDRNIIIFFMGILGVLVALFGNYYDETIKYLKELLEKTKDNIIELEEEIQYQIEELKEEGLKYKIEELKEKVKDNTLELGEKIQNKTEELKEEGLKYKIEELKEKFKDNILELKEEILNKIKKLKEEGFKYKIEELKEKFK